MERNKRKLFIKDKVRNYFIFYCFFSILIVVLFLGWEIWIELLHKSFPIDNSSIGFLRGFPMVIKVSLLLLWGMFSFLLSYSYLDAKFMGIFSRMNTLFKNMLHDEQLVLRFRTGDPFGFLADSFNTMRQNFLTRIKRRKEMIQALHQKIQNLPPDASPDAINEIVKDIDQELER